MTERGPRERDECNSFTACQRWKVSLLNEPMNDASRSTLVGPPSSVHAHRSRPITLSVPRCWLWQTLLSVLSFNKLEELYLLKPTHPHPLDCSMVQRAPLADTAICSVGFRVLYCSCCGKWNQKGSPDCILYSRADGLTHCPATSSNCLATSAGCRPLVPSPKNN
jgi:hypothetical protein